MAEEFHRTQVKKVRAFDQENTPAQTCKDAAWPILSSTDKVSYTHTPGHVCKCPQQNRVLQMQMFACIFAGAGIMSVLAIWA